MSDISDTITVRQGTVSDTTDYARLLLLQRTEKDGERAMNQRESVSIAQQYLSQGTVYVGQVEDRTLGFTETRRALNQLGISNMYVEDASLRETVETEMGRYLVEYAKSEDLERVYTSVHKKSDGRDRIKRIFKSLGFETYEPNELQGLLHLQFWLDEPAPK